jgi:hypothetical protein
MSAALERNLPSNPALNVVIAYEGFASGQHAVQMYHRLMLERGNPADVDIKTWAFNMLRNRKLNNAAVEAAAEAEVIIIATEGEKLPSAVEKWLEGWRRRPTNNHPTSVVGVLDRPAACDNQLSPMEKFLRSVASSTGSDFLMEDTGRLETRDY